MDITQLGAVIQGFEKVRVQANVTPEPTVIIPALSDPEKAGFVPQDVTVDPITAGELR